MEFPRWTDEDVECSESGKIGEENVDHVLWVIIVQDPLVQFYVSREVDGEGSQAGELCEHLSKSERSPTSR